MLVKLNANLIDTWLNKVPGGLNHFLIYGPEQGKAQAVCHKLINYFKKKFTELDLQRFNYKQLKDHPMLLIDEVMSLSLLGGQKVIIVDESAATLSKELLTFLKTPNKSNALLIFLSEELKPTSNLRKSFEDGAASIAIACYKDDTAQIANFISQYLKQNNMAFAKEVAFLLAENLPANQLLVINELEKLITYKADDPDIGVDDVIACIGNASEIAYDDICRAVVDGNSKIIQANISKMRDEDINFVMIIRILLKFFLRVLEVKGKVKATGDSIDRTVSSLAPPVFFKQKDNLIHAVNRLDDKKVMQYIDELVNLELQCKRGKFDPQVLTFNLLTYWGKQA